MSDAVRTELALRIRELGLGLQEEAALADELTRTAGLDLVRVAALVGVDDLVLVLVAVVIGRLGRARRGGLLFFLVLVVDDGVVVDQLVVIDEGVFIDQ